MRLGEKVTGLTRDSGRKGFGGDSICTICGETFKTTGLSFHIRHAHPESYKFLISCEICGKGLSSKKSLEMHILAKHTPGGKEKIRQSTENICQLCGKRVLNMKKHMETHDESTRPKDCTYCGKQFPKYHLMTCHRRIAHRDQWNKDKETIMVKEGSVCLPGSRADKMKKKWCLMQKEKLKSIKK